MDEEIQEETFNQTVDKLIVESKSALAKLYLLSSYCILAKENNFSVADIKKITVVTFKPEDTTRSTQLRDKYRERSDSNGEVIHSVKITLKGVVDPEVLKEPEPRTIVVHSPSLEFVSCHRKSKEWR